MKLNAKGEALYDKWERIYWEEITKQRKQRGDPDFCEGWCIIDDWDHIHDINDEIGLLIFGYEDDAIYHVISCVIDGYLREDENWSFDVSASQLVELMKPYFDITDDDDLSFSA